MHVWLSGQKQWTHNPSPNGYHRFKPCHMQIFTIKVKIKIFNNKVKKGKGIRFYNY